MTMVVWAPALNDKREPHVGALATCSNGMVVTYTNKYLHPGEGAAFPPGLGGTTLLIEGATVALAIFTDTTHPQHPVARFAWTRRVNARSGRRLALQFEPPTL